MLFARSLFPSNHTSDYLFVFRCCQQSFAGDPGSPSCLFRHKDKLLDCILQDYELLKHEFVCPPSWPMFSAQIDQC